MTDHPLQKKIDPTVILEHITQCVITTDLNGIVTYWNAASEYIFGYSREEMLNQSVGKIYPSVAKDQFREDLKNIEKHGYVEGKRKSITKDGMIIWIDVHAMPLKNDSGEIEAIVATAHDIQHLKKIEKELEENKAQAQAILETTVDGIITIDEEARILSFNKAASSIFGYNEDEIRWRNIKLLIPNLHGPDFFKQYFRTGRRREMTGQRKDGSLFPMELSVSEVKWNGKRIFTGVINDISERRRLEREILRISEEERHNLGQDLHDGLGQMLTGISLISKNLARKLQSNGIPGADKVLEISNLIKEADEYAKALAHGLVHVDFEEEGLQAALRQLCRQAEKLFNINCSFHYDTEPKIHANIKAMNLYRIAQEAISNAVKHGKAQNIDIELTFENGAITLSIEDDGVGLTNSRKENKEKGMGIQIMKYRANILSGNLEIIETENNKTLVICNIPHNN